MFARKNRLDEYFKTGTMINGQVTADQIKNGKIKYYIKYTVQEASGPKEATRTVPVTIQTEEAAPQLSATYSVSPSSAKEGQTVTLAYTLSNTGNIELRNIVIENDGVKKEDVTAASLSVGEKITLEDSFVMGKKEVVSNPTVHYEAAGSNKRLTISDMARKTISVAEDGLEVALKPAMTENVYPGESVKMTLELKNSGNTAYSNLSAQLSSGEQIASGVELAPGASYKKEFEAVIDAAGEYSVSVTGKDSNGENAGVVSEPVTITTLDPSLALVLDVYAQAREEVIYSEPAVVRFAVVVVNSGETDATNLTVRQAGTKVAQIAALPSGESCTLVLDLETSIAGKFQFAVSGKDAAGSERTYESNVIELTYTEPTPAPTAKPTPSPVPPTPTPEPTATPEPALTDVVKDFVNDHVTKTTLYAVAGALAGLLALILMVSGVRAAGRAKRVKNALDTIELTPDVRNHRGVVRRSRKADKAKHGRKDEHHEAIVPTTELTEEEAAHTPQPAKEEAPAPAREENRRRRAAAEVQVTNDETLRVAPVDQRPEFIAQGKVDDSQTRIFGRLPEQEAAMAKAAESAPVQAEADAQEAPAEQTIRLSRDQMETALREAEAKAAGPKADKKAPKAKKEKKKKGFFARHKDEDDDFVDADDPRENPDDDFFE